MGIAAVLLGAGAQADSANSHGLTPLLRAGCNGRADLVALLLGHGANRMITNRHGQSCLYLAAKQGYREVVRILLEACLPEPHARGARAPRAASFRRSPPPRRVAAAASPPRRRRRRLVPARNDDEPRLLRLSLASLRRPRVSAERTKLCYRPDR